MAKVGTYGYRAELARRKAQRTIAKLEKTISNKNLSTRLREAAKQEKRSLQGAIQGTRSYSKSGKRYKKSAAYKEKALNKLESLLSETRERFAPAKKKAGNSFQTVQQEMRRAKVGLPSVYTKTEVDLFYRVTQKYWQREGVSRNKRNEAIMDAINAGRKENGLSPLTFEQVVEFVLEKNKTISNTLDRASEIERKGFDEEQDDFYDINKVQGADNADGAFESPPGVAEKVVQGIKDALSELFVIPDFNEYITQG